MHLETLLIDFDGTLASTNYFYYKPQLRCASIIIQALKHDSIDPGKLIARADDLRKESIADGWKSRYHFENSWIDLYRELCLKTGHKPKNTVEKRLFAAAEKYRTHNEYRLFPGVPEALRTIKQRKILCTLGHVDIQTRKIEMTGLDKLLDDIEIVAFKNIATYKGLLAKYKLDPATTAMIGDNTRLDIAPAMDCNIMTFHILGKHQAPFITGMPLKYQTLHTFAEVLSYL